MVTIGSAAKSTRETRVVGRVDWRSTGEGTDGDLGGRTGKYRLHISAMTYPLAASWGMKSRRVGRVGGRNAGGAPSGRLEGPDGLTGGIAARGVLRAGVRLGATFAGS